MRQRERERIERRARELCAWEDPDVASRFEILWSREIPDAYGLALTHLVWVIVSESHWRLSDPAERADTIAHELAHLITWARDPDAPTHGRKWAACFRRLREIAVEMEW